MQGQWVDRDHHNQRLRFDVHSVGLRSKASWD